MEEPLLTFLSSSLIVPSTTSSHPKTLFLSSLDLIWCDVHYNRRIVFYPNLPEHAYDSALHCLRTSLSLALVQFYPWAGRLAVGEDGRMVIDCNDRGVEFLEAAVDMRLSCLQDDGFQQRPFFDKLSQRGEGAASGICDIPLLSIQLTKFVGGGIALGFSNSHVIADGQSIWHFMTSWAECGRGDSISVPPFHQRTLLKVDTPSEEIAGLSFMRPEEEHDRTLGVNLWSPSQKLVQRLFHFTGEVLQTLKSVAAKDAKGTYTTYEALCAHFWRCVTRARAIEEKEKVHFTVLVNCRSKMHALSLPPTYFGNVIHFAIAVATAGELARESLGTTASRIHEAVASCKEGTVRGLMHWCELHGNRLLGELVLKSEGMLVGSSPRFPVYEVDFGWGRPAAVRMAKVKGDGEMLLTTGKEKGSVDICMPLKEEAMARLEKDMEFLSCSR